MTNVSAQGEMILKTNLLANALDQALTHYSANSNAPAALQVYEETKSVLQARETMDQTGRQAAHWMQYFKNIIEAVLYSVFLFIYFLSYFPFGASIISNYLRGLFVLQTLSPMYAIINFAANSLAQNRSLSFLASDAFQSGLSIANIAGITEANADAMAVAGYLMWPVTLIGGTMLFRGLPSAIQSMGQLMGGTLQHAGGHVAAEAIGGNISAGNTSFGNHSLNNMNANHWDSNVRYAAGSATFQTNSGSSISVTANGNEVMNNQGALSNLGVSVHMAESMKTAVSHQAQSSLTASFNQSMAAGKQYSTGLRHIVDYAEQGSHGKTSGESFSSNESGGISQAANTVSKLVDSFAKSHHVSHERAAAILGQVYADIKGGFSVLGSGVTMGAQGSFSANARSAFGSLYNEAKQFSEDKGLVENVDAVKREIKEGHFREQSEQSHKLGESIASSFDQGDHFRNEAVSQLAKSNSYSALASTFSENAATINSNYTQAFYDWMRHEPSPAAQYGQGMWSRSAIEDMAIHDPQNLQHYADRFVQLKTNESLNQFENAHHLNNHQAGIENTYQQNNVEIPKKPHLDQVHAHFDNQVKNKSSNNNFQVNETIKTDVTKQLEQDKAQIEQKKLEINRESIPIKNKVDEKIKGQVVESTLPHGLTHALKNMEKNPSFISVLKGKNDEHE